MLGAGGHANRPPWARIKSGIGKYRPDAPMLVTMHIYILHTPTMHGCRMEDRRDANHASRSAGCYLWIGGGGKVSAIFVRSDLGLHGLRRADQADECNVDVTVVVCSVPDGLIFRNVARQPVFGRLGPYLPLDLC